MEQIVSGRLIFYVGQIEPLDLFTYELVRAFEKMDYEIFVYDLQNQGDSLRGLEKFCQKKVDAVITFNTMFYNMQLTTGKNAWDEMKIRFITILVDHPDNFKDTLLKFSDNEIVLCIDKNHMSYVGRFFPNVVTFGFLPHGGKEFNCNNRVTFAARKMDVMYAGGIPNTAIRALQVPVELVIKYQEFFDVKMFVVSVCNKLLSNPMKTIEAAIEQVLQEMNMWLEDDVLGCVLSDFMFIHSYILAYYRGCVLESVAKSGVELYIFGGGWEAYEWTRLNNVHLMGMISAEQVLEEMENSKIVLSTMAWFKDGAHERVFNGMLAKALVVSETTIYLEENFNDLEEGNPDIVLYRLDKLEELPERIKYVLNHEDEAVEIIERGYLKVREKHTWQMRAKEIAEELLGFNLNRIELGQNV